MAKVPGFLSWPPAFSPAFLSSFKSLGTDQHGSVGPAKNLTGCAVVWLEGTTETKSQPSITNWKPGLFQEDILRLLFYLVHLPGSHWGGAEKDPHHTWPGPKLASVCCALGDLRPLTNESPPSSERRVYVEQDPHQGVNLSSCSLLSRDNNLLL